MLLLFKQRDSNASPRQTWLESSIHKNCSISTLTDSTFKSTPIGTFGHFARTLIPTRVVIGASAFLSSVDCGRIHWASVMRRNFKPGWSPGNTLIAHVAIISLFHTKVRQNLSNWAFFIQPEEGGASDVTFKGHNLLDGLDIPIPLNNVEKLGFFRKCKNSLWGGHTSWTTSSARYVSHAAWQMLTFRDYGGGKKNRPRKVENCQIFLSIMLCYHKMEPKPWRIVK